MENKLLQALEMMVGEASLQDPFGDEGSREILELARSVIAEAKAHLTQRAADGAVCASCEYNPCEGDERKGDFCPLPRR